MDRRTWISKSGVLYTSLMLGPYLGMASMPVEDVPSAIKLNQNENPYGCSPKALKAYKSAEDSMNRYAFPSISELKKTFAAHYSLSDKHVMIGPGSSYLLESVGQFMLRKEGAITSPSVTFDILPAYLERFGSRVHRLALQKDHTIDLAHMAINAEKHPGLVYIVNPNNPTGTALDSDDLIAFINEVSAHSYVLVDEAYLEFSDSRTSMVSLVAKNPHVIVLKTMSKIYGMAGLRIGYGFAHPDTVTEIEKHQIFPGVFTSTASFAAAEAALKDGDFLKFVDAKNQEAKKLVYKTLDQLKIDYIPSQTSFILFDISSFKGDFLTVMAEENILIATRDYLDKKWCRVSMGTVAQMQQFTKTLQKIWS